MANPRVWQLHEAKAQFNEVFRRARLDGSQRVMNQRGKAVVVVRAEDLTASPNVTGSRNRFSNSSDPRHEEVGFI